MDLTKKAGRASTRRADPAPGYLLATPIADLPRTDAKVVFIPCHETTIESQNAPDKREMRTS
jgi:hypothetical protein